MSISPHPSYLVFLSIYPRTHIYVCLRLTLLKHFYDMNIQYLKQTYYL